MQRKIFLSACFCLGLITFQPAAAAPEMAKVFIETHENNGYYGDAIRVVFSTVMALQSHNDSRISYQEGVNTPKAPAGYSDQGGASAINAARNYTVTITPEQGSNTTPYTGTWADLGGRALFDPHDPHKRTILLLPPQPNATLFRPGDTVEVTLAPTIQDAAGQPLNPAQNKRKNRSS